MVSAINIPTFAKHLTLSLYLASNVLPDINCHLEDASWTKLPSVYIIIHYQQINAIPAEIHFTNIGLIQILDKLTQLLCLSIISACHILNSVLISIYLETVFHVVLVLDYPMENVLAQFKEHWIVTFLIKLILNVLHVWLDTFIAIG